MSIRGNYEAINQTVVKNHGNGNRHVVAHCDKSEIADELAIKLNQHSNMVRMLKEELDKAKTSIRSIEEFLYPNEDDDNG